MADIETDLPFGICKTDAEFLKFFHCNLKELRSIVISNIEYYQRGKSSIHACFYATFCVLLERTQVLENLVIDIVPKLKDFDFSEEVQANGYRSFISIVNRCCLHLLQLCRHISFNKRSLLFRSSHYLKETEAYVEVLGQLMACLGYLQKLMLHCQEGNLFLADEEDIGDDLLLEVEMLNTDCFYGRCLGFQFSESMQKVLQTVVIAMATFSECYEEDSQVFQIASSVINSGKYYVDPELRAKQVVDVTRTADIKFCKAFWSITESPLLHQLRSFTFPHVEVSEVFSLEPENFELPHVGSTDDNDTVVITPPCAHTGPAPVKVRLISHAIREGMQVSRRRFQPKTGSSKPEILPKSQGLIFHCHGGGFVAQSSQSHENYLRLWAKKLEMPILSVDYSLSPDQPFPRAVEETFYAYAWALKHPEKLGWTGEHVCFAGDSAGGNIVVSTALRAASYEIRMPDGIMAAYMAALVQYTPSPARLLSMIDPLLPVGILTRCLAAYAGIADKFSSALATPIFCNPGKIEDWEMVDSSICCDGDHSGTACEKAPVKHCDEILSNEQCGNSGDDSKTGQVQCSADTKTVTTAACSSNCSTADDTVSSVFHSNDSRKQSLNSLSDSEFVVCDKETVEAIDGKLVEKNSTVTILETVCQVVEKTVKTILDGNDQSGSYEEISLTEFKKSPSEDASQSSGSKSGKKEISSDQNVKAEESNGTKLFSSLSPVKDMLTKIDSDAKIEVEDVGTREAETSSPSELYATCSELLSEGQGPLTTQGDDMMSQSCHSLEDLLCPDNDCLGDAGSAQTDQLETPQFYLDVQEAEQDVPDRNILQSRENNVKQISLSDNSDSGINDLTEAESDTPCNQQMDAGGQASSCPRNKTDNCHGDKNDAKISDSELHRFADRRNMSLDFVTFHPGHSSELSPVKSQRSPLSPALSPGSRPYAPKLFSVQRKIAQSPVQLFRHLPIVKNMYMSPLLAPDTALLKLPPVHLTACHFDPLLDDSVMFAKKLAGLGKSVSLKVFDNLPHGFLCFSDASVEARQATNFCMEKIKEVLQVKEKF